MKRIFVIIMAALMCFAVGCGGGDGTGGTGGTGGGGGGGGTANGNVLVAYFSWSGNTEEIAGFVAAETGGDLVEIVPSSAYTTDYTALLSVASDERTRNARPAISADTYAAIDISNYSAVFIGYPIWHGNEPMIIRTFIDHYSGFENMSVFTFSSSGSSGGGAAHTSIASLCADTATVGSNLHFTSRTLGGAQASVHTWVSGLTLPSPSVEGVRLRLAFSETEVFITLADNSATRDLVSRLRSGAITLSFSDYGGSEKIAYPSPPLDTSNNAGYNPAVGDLTIFVPWGNLAAFYRDTSDFSASLMYVGKFEGNGIELLAAQDEDFSAVLSIAE